MREILFKAKTVKNVHWIWGDLFHAGTEPSDGEFAISYRSFLPCTIRQFSGSDLDTYFIPSMRWQYPNKKILFCQAFSISSALFNVVSVILAPPIIRASSLFLPSRSRGVTVV